ncbi:sigma-70 family RNA polymerase sigma factor [uncultured Clostridium sp.]|uniref:sigma-70 family RNA polymerase sigma factor n=1 Tax=uncultured Clostridium sp. TaxID=59620 RepID=UPI0025F641E0|nr:sigma-70 family RNA polymerase sigma factor [uncultured Clostridium sp.]
MDFDYIEELVAKAKNNDDLCKEALVNEFRPFIINFCKKTYVDGYDFEDLQNECYSALFVAVEKYNVEHHRFVSYSIKIIKNTIYSLISKKEKLKKIDGISSLWESTNMEFFGETTHDSIDSNILFQQEKSSIIKAINNLSKEEKYIIEHTVLRKNSMLEFSKTSNIPYSTLIRKRKCIINKLYNYVKDEFLN